MTESPDLLTERTVVAYLGGLGILDPTRTDVQALGGGVSNVVLAAWDDTHSVVVKQALPRLRVAEEWLAPQDRVMAEAAALERVAQIDVDSVPRLLHRDAARHVIVLQRAPADWQDWKSLLLGGRINGHTAEWIGSLLGQIQQSTKDDTQDIGIAAAFEALRVDPYYRTAASRTPEVATLLAELIERMTSRRDCLVHGDLSPKNFLTSPSGSDSWLIDFEVAHVGDATFDVAFLLSHLLLKAIHRSMDRAAYFGCATAFTASYQAASGRTELGPDTFVHVGALMLARVRGKSPVEYLSPDERNVAAQLGVNLVRAPAHSVEEMLARTAKAVQ